MDTKGTEENQIMRQILSAAKIGWWKADFSRRMYVLSDFMMELFGLSDREILFDDFIGFVREDYRMRLKNEFDTYTNQFIYDREIPFHTPKGEVWLRAKVISRVENPDGTVTDIGSAQIVPSPLRESGENTQFVRTNNLLHQLNSISQTLLTLLNADGVDDVINRILRDILAQFKGGRAYLFEYDWENNTQSCTYEVTDKGVTSEVDLLDKMPMSAFPWWNQQIREGKMIILSSLDELPAEAGSVKDLLAMQDIRSLMVAPLMSKDGPWGFAGIDIVEEYHQWSNEDCQWFASLVNIINICIALRRSEQQAQKERGYLQNLYRHMPLGYIRLKVLYDQDGRPEDYLFLDANPAMEGITGYSNAEYVGSRASEKGRDVKAELEVLLQALNSDHYIEMTTPMDQVEKHVRTILYSTQQDEVVCLLSDMTEILETHRALDRSEKILRNIFDNLPAGVELYDRDGRLVNLNNKDMELFGVRKEDAVGLSFYDNPNVPAEIKEKVRNRQDVSFKLNYSFDQVNEYYSSGKTGYVEIYTTVSMLYDSDGKLINFLLINIDNTEINRAHSRIAEFESSFSLVSRFGKVGYCRFDLNTREGYGFPQWYRNLGETEDTPLSEVIGVYNHVNPQDKAHIMDCIGRVKAGEIDNFMADLRVRTQEGEKWTRVNVMRNLMNTDPSKLEMICVNYDVTEVKETEKRLIEAKNKAEVSDRLKSAFLANMSHEIRTPLNAIVGFSNLLVETTDEAEKQEYIQIVQENNELLLKLISDILDLSKIEAGTFEFINGPVDVNQLCNEIVRSMEMKSQGSGVEVLFGEHLPDCRMVSDKSRLTQVITNFINNALKFTSKGSVTLSYCRTSDTEITFYVADTGSGIPAEQLSSIFDRFVKLNSFMQGTGLGLSICKSIVEQMGGRIGVESKVGEGSTFWFAIPFVEVPGGGGSDRKKPSSKTLPTGEVPGDEDKPTILIAEDTDSNYLLIFLMLKKEYNIVRAHNGVEAVDLHAKIHPDMILMDIKMPEMDGIEATRRIRKTDPSVPIVAITAFALDQDRRRSFEAGCNEYMSKPLQGSQLKEKICQYLR